MGAPPLTLRIGERAGSPRLPIVLELPLPEGPLVLATRERWPVDKDLYCAQLEGWPEDAQETERVTVSSCRRVGAALQLVLERATRRRSMFVWTSKHGRPLIFWRSERSMRALRPSLRTPSARAQVGTLALVIDLRERHPWRFRDLPVASERRRLPAGDYGVFDDAGELVAVVERKKIDEFAGNAVAGSLQLQLAELASLPRALVLVEGRLSQLLKKDAQVPPAWMLNLVAGLQAAHPNVPIWFAESGPLAANLAYRWLSACLQQHHRQPHPLFAGTPEAAGVAGAAAQRVATPSPTVTLANTTPEREQRQSEALARALAGETLTIRAHALRYHVEAGTASADLNTLAAQGLLRACGHGRGRHFVAKRGDGGR
jgi:hypothetical protein